MSMSVSNLVLWVGDSGCTSLSDRPDCHFASPFANYRELKEECGVSVKKMIKIGILHFEFEGNYTIMEVHVFKADHFIGVPTESDGKHDKTKFYWKCSPMAYYTP